jgi:hypothetical protein
MPVTRNVAWDGRLESFKGADTTDYVLTAAALAKACTACREPLKPGQPLSLLVNITQCTAPDGTEYLTFTDSVCHRQCNRPALTIERIPWQLQPFSSLSARIILTQESGADLLRVVPVLAFTVVPVVTFREQGGDRTSALVTLLLSQGFQLGMSADYEEILDQATSVDSGCSFTGTPEGVIKFRIDGEVLHHERLQLNQPYAPDAQWLQAARSAGHVLIISGDNLDISESTLGLHGAARQGTLVIGTVPFTEEP